MIHCSKSTVERWEMSEKPIKGPVVFLLKLLESWCFPRTRDKMKLILKDLDLPFYDPFLLIEKTEGKMAEDNFWIKIER